MGPPRHFLAREDVRVHDLPQAGVAAFPFVAPEGGKDPLQAVLAEFTLGRDHEVYTDGSFRIPAVYLNDWPDRYVHTNFDSPANIDPTKLLRAGVITAATGWVLANVRASDAARVLDVIRPQSLERAATALRRMRLTDTPDLLSRFQSWHERGVIDSMARFFEVPADVKRDAERLIRQVETVLGASASRAPDSGDAAVVYARRADPKGPMSVFGYDYLTDKYGAARAGALTLPQVQARWGGGDYAYEALNLADGKRTVGEIRDMLSAIYGPVALEPVARFLRALEAIEVIERR